MNTSEYTTAALGHVTNYHGAEDSYIARKCVKAGVTTYQLATNIRPGEKGGLAIDWMQCTEREFSLSLPGSRMAPGTTPAVGSRVQRVGSGTSDGKTGSVVEVQDSRARVMWDGDKRTWVAFRFLRVIA